MKAISLPSGDHVGLNPLRVSRLTASPVRPMTKIPPPSRLDLKGDTLAVRRERRLIVIVGRVGRQIDWRLTGRALKKDVSIAVGSAP